MRVGRVGVVAMAVLQFWHAPTALGAPLDSVAALTPGGGLATFTADLQDGDTCTAGFLVRDKGGHVGMLTAGHCDKGGAAAIKLSGMDYTRIGTFDAGLRRGDIGFVPLMPGIPVNAAVNGGEPTTGVSGQVATGDVLCKAGLSTGRQCGPVTDVNGETVTFAATTQCGDSGGPVYVSHPDGTATAVGITIAETMGDTTVRPSCGPEFTFAIAQLIRPWLTATGRTLVTS